MHRFALISLLVLAGCGLSNGTKLKDLEASDAEALCDKMGPEETITCDVEGYSIDITVGCDPDEINEDNFNENTFPESCEATVGDLLDCLDAIKDAFGADDCADQMSEQPSECDAYYACLGLDD